jgi:hypothetical protein
VSSSSSSRPKTNARSRKSRSRRYKGWCRDTFLTRRPSKARSKQPSRSLSYRKSSSTGTSLKWGKKVTQDAKRLWTKESSTRMRPRS